MSVVRLGQNFLADPNLLDAIVREAALGPGEVVLEIGGGEGALSERLAEHAATVHVVELDRRLEERLGEVVGRRPNIRVHWADAMRLDIGTLDPAPTAVVANLPYSIATPIILKTIAELPGVGMWTLMVQREIADRLRAAPGSRLYGSPSVLVQLSCRVELRRRVDPAVFVPRPRVEAALRRLARGGPAASDRVREIVRGGFAHRRKALARSLELAGAASADAVRAALAALGHPRDARAEALRPDDFVALAERLAS